MSPSDTPTAGRPRGRPRDEEHTAQRRENILDAATQIFARDGFGGTDVQHIADSLGLGKGTIYRYFPTKSELFLAAVDRGMQQLTDCIDRAAAECPDLLEQMHVAIRTYLSFFKNNPNLVELLIQERAEFRDRQTPTYFVYRARNIQRWEDVIRQLIAAGRLRPVPPERVSQVMGDMLYGAMFTNYFAGRQIEPERQAADILDIAFHGVLSDREREKLQ